MCFMKYKNITHFITVNLLVFDRYFIGDIFRLSIIFLITQSYLKNVETSFNFLNDGREIGNANFKFQNKVGNKIILINLSFRKVLKNYTF